MDRDDPGLFITARTQTPGVPTNLLSVDPDALLGIPTVMHEAFLYADTTDPDADIPGRRWGSYYTVAHAGTLSLQSTAIDNQYMPARRLQITTAVGGVGYFEGIRTGDGPNNQDTMGYWLIRHQPVCSVLFSIPVAVSAWEQVEFGFYNDVNPLDSDPSRVYILLDGTAGTAILHIVASDGTDVAGVTDLLSVGVISPDWPYAFKIAIDDESNARAAALHIPANAVGTDSVSLGVKSMTISGYSFYFIGRTTDAGQATIVDLLRFTVSDKFYAGPITPFTP